MSAVTTTSAISIVPTEKINQRGRKIRSRTYTSTRVTGPTGNPPTYATEIIRYDDAKGNNPTVIGTRDNDGKTSWNDNATASNKRNAEAINDASANQVDSMSSSLATTAQQKAALNKSAGQGNQAQGDGDNQSTPSPKSNTKAAGGTRTSGFPHLIFPESLKTIDRDVLKMTMVKYNPSGFAGGTQGNTASLTSMGKGRDATKTEIGSVMLPVPGGISDTQSVDWGSGTMDPIQAAAASVAMTALQKGLTAGADVATDLAKEAAKNGPDVKKGLASVIAGSATQIGKQALQRGEGMVLNPNMELLFNGPQLRTFGFTFKLSPRSSREAQTAVKIIRFFKQGMSPIRSESNFFLKSPHTFTLKYMMGKGRGEQKYLNKFKECALQNCTVQYTPDGNYNTFTDGIMTSYSLQLTFNELTPVFNDDYGNGSFDAAIGF